MWLRVLIRGFLLTLVSIPLIAVFIFVRDLGKRYYCEKQPATVRPIPPLKKFSWSGSGLITITFDDAFISQGSPEVVKYLDDNGMPASLSVPTGLVCTRGYMSWNEILALQDKGWEITSHSVSHFCKKYKYTKQNIPIEVLQAKHDLNQRGLRADNFVIPCGFNQRILPDVYSLAKKNYRSYRRAGEKINPLPVLDPYDLTSYGVSYDTTNTQVQQWIDEAVSKKGWLIIVFHQIDDYKIDYHATFAQFKEIITLVKKSGLPVVLPDQVLDIKYDISKSSG